VEDLVYGEALGSIVFMRRTRARDLATVGALLERDVTWGNVRASVSPSFFKEIQEVYPDDELPPDEAPFDAEWMDESSWPFLHQEQIALLPKDVVALGSIEDTVFDGERLDIPTAAEAAAIERLRAHGYNVERDDDLVKLACMGC
jgi:hypothetical protein